MRSRFGGWPSIGIEPLAGLVQPRQRLQQTHRVRHLRAVEDLLGRAVLDHVAAVHHEHVLARLGHDAEVVGDQDDRRAQPLLHLVHQLDDLRLDRHVERGRRLVGDQHGGIARERHRDHHALAHAAGELVRIVAQRASRRPGSAPAAASRRPCRARLSCCSPRCSRTASAICSPTVSTGFSEVIGSWKIIAMSLPRIFRISASLFSSRFSPLKRILPRSIAPGLRDQPHDRERGDRLAGTRLADDAERRARLDREREPVDGATTPSSVLNVVLRSWTSSSAKRELALNSRQD